MAETVIVSVLTGMSFAQKEQLLRDLASTWEIYLSAHGLEESMRIATGGGDRYRRLEVILAEAVGVIGTESGVQPVIEHAIRAVRQS